MRTVGAKLFALFVLIPAFASAQTSPRQASVVGLITNASGAGVDGVVVRLEGLEHQAISNADGRFQLVRVPAGPQVIIAEHLGFAMARVRITVPAQGEVRKDIQLAEQALELEGITVNADAVGRARGELGTATVIAEDAIRHQTATSLAGVLELLPGVELRPPGLGSTQQIPLRAVRTSGSGGGAGAGQLAAFGTLIILDGVPLSNNANLQSAGAGAALSFSTTSGGGVDLRRIPAATLERLEVIRGIPSARYGDLTQGAVVVETRAGEVEPEVRSQYDPYTLETTVLGGWETGRRTSTTTYLDYARTRSRPGVTDDYANRFAGQLSHRLSLAGSDPVDGETPFTLESRVDWFRLEEDLPPNENTRPGFSSYTRDGGIRISERVRMPFVSGSQLTLIGSITRVWQRAESTAGLVRETMPFTDRLTEG